jgi:hypothetical protein
MTATIRKLRCARDPRRLLAKMHLDGDRPAYFDAHPQGRNLIELACHDCEKVERRADSGVVRVLHRFNFIGRFEETAYVYGDGREEVRTDG